MIIVQQYTKASKQDRNIIFISKIFEPEATGRGWTFSELLAVPGLDGFEGGVSVGDVNGLRNGGGSRGRRVGHGVGTAGEADSGAAVHRGLLEDQLLLQAGAAPLRRGAAHFCPRVHLNKTQQNIWYITKKLQTKNIL